MSSFLGLLDPPSPPPPLPVCFVLVSIWFATNTILQHTVYPLLDQREGNYTTNMDMHVFLPLPSMYQQLITQSCHVPAARCFLAQITIIVINSYCIDYLTILSRSSASFIFSIASLAFASACSSNTLAWLVFPSSRWCSPLELSDVWLAEMLEG